MSQPPDYSPSTTFSSEAGFDGAKLDTEFSNINSTLDALVGNIAKIQRDDTKLSNDSVHVQSVSASVLALFISTWSVKGAWVAATSYVTKDLVENDGKSYLCIVDHTSTTIAADIAASKWVIVSTNDPLGGWNSPVDKRNVVLDTGVANAMAFTPDPAPLVTDTLADEQNWIVIPAATNTGPTTAVIGVIPGATLVKKYDRTGALVDLDGGDIVAARPAGLIKYGAQLLLIDIPYDESTVAITGGSIAGVTFTDTTNIIQTIHSANATHTFNTRTKHYLSEVWGAGGGGGRSTTTSSGQGAAGGYSSRLAVKTSATATIVIGVGGIATSGDPGTGGTGGTSSFTDGTETLTCTGGAGGVGAGAGGIGGSATGGDKNYPGPNGMNTGGHQRSGAALSTVSLLAVGVGGLSSSTGVPSEAGGPGQIIVTEFVI